MPAQKVAYLISHYPDDIAAMMRTFDCFSVHINKNIIDKKLVDEIHAFGKKVWVFPIEHPGEVNRLKAIGVDAIFTNYPDTAVSICHAMTHQHHRD